MSHSHRALMFFLWLWIVHSAANHITFIDDLYSSNNIYLAWSISSPLIAIEPHTFQYRECCTEQFKSATINDASNRYENNSLNTSNVYSATLTNLSPDTVYQIKISPQHDHMFRVRTLALNDWKLFIEKVAPYAVGAVGAVILAPVALDMLGFGSIGITAGSVAAAIQSEIGLVEAGSTFSILQSAGMAGMSSETLLGVALNGAGIVSRITELVVDECHDTDYVRSIEHKFKDIQYFALKNIDTIDVESLKECIASYVNDVDVDVDIDSFWDTVQSEYNTVYDKVVGEISEVDWEKQKNAVTGTYHKVKSKIMSGMDELFAHKKN